MIPIVAPVIGLFRRFGGALRRGWGEPEFRGLLYLVSIVVASGTIFYRAVEDWTWVDSVYFTVITLTTVGYGDLSPVDSRLQDLHDRLHPHRHRPARDVHRAGRQVCGRGTRRKTGRQTQTRRPRLSRRRT